MLIVIKSGLPQGVVHVIVMTRARGMYCIYCTEVRGRMVIAILYPEAMATVFTEFVTKKSSCSLHSCRLCSARRELSVVSED